MIALRIYAKLFGNVPSDDTIEDVQAMMQQREEVAQKLIFGT